MIEEIRNKIVEIALTYVNEKELKGNQGFENDFIQREFEAIGWKKGWAYCAFFGKLVWSKAYGHFDSSIITELGKLFDPSAVKTWNNFYRSRKFKTGIVPEPGDLAIFQKYHNDIADWRGHLCIVEEKHQLFFKSIDGNTNPSGGREGDGFYQKNREYSFYEENGLRLLGFVKPKNV